MSATIEAIFAEMGHQLSVDLSAQGLDYDGYGISPQLYQQLRHTLLNCGPFSSQNSLHAIFTDERIAHWQQNLPDGHAPMARVEAVIAYLRPRHNTHLQQNALVLFLQVLAERIDPLDNCHQTISDLSQQLAHEIKRHTTDLTKTKTAFWFQAANRYCQYIQRHYGVIHMLGHHEPVSLDAIFTDVYVLDKPTALRRYSREQMAATYIETQQLSDLTQRVRRLAGLDIVEQANKIFILGGPGSGKTTFLKYLTLQAIDNKITRVPIFVSLRELSESKQNLLTYISQQFAVCDIPEAETFVLNLLKSGKALVLLDGLDEVNQEDDERQNMINALELFINRYSQSQHLITCRLAANEYIFNQFRYVEMANFTGRQIEQFVFKWFDRQPHKKQAFLTALKQPQHKGLREIAQTPLFLTLLCLAFAETLSFPQRNVELYEEALNALLKKWDSSRNIKRDDMYRHLSLGRRQQMLSWIAYQTFKDGDIIMSKKQLLTLIRDYMARMPAATSVADIDAEAILQAIMAQHGIFVERAKGVYTFAHLSFHEYFAARFISDNEARGTIPTLLQHLSHEQWHSIFTLTASLLPEADDFFFQFHQELNQMVQLDGALYGILRWIRAAPERPKADITSLQAVRQLAVALALAIRLALDRALTTNHRRLYSRQSLLHQLIVPTTPSQDILHEVQQLCEQDVGRYIVLAGNLAKALGQTLQLGELLAHINQVADNIRLDFQLGRTRVRNLLHDLTRALELDKTAVRLFIQTREVAQDLANLPAKRLNDPLRQYDDELRQLLDQTLYPAHSLHRTIERALDLDQTLIRYLDRPEENLVDKIDLKLYTGINLDTIRTLQYYLQGSQLLLHCLQIAIVTERHPIENALLDPLQVRIH
ncbi:MAG TPA: NACHT domain-containing protein [Anaerolineae bacterium]|nr:NACHT domain-containing protein [Anaerolineae bacterium]